MFYIFMIYTTYGKTVWIFFAFNIVRTFTIWYFLFICLYLNLSQPSAGLGMKVALLIQGSYCRESPWKGCLFQSSPRKSVKVLERFLKIPKNPWKSVKMFSYKKCEIKVFRWYSGHHISKGSSTMVKKIIQKVWN